MAKEDDYAVKAAKEWVEKHHDESITDCEGFVKSVEDAVAELAEIIRKHVDARPGYRNMS